MNLLLIQFTLSPLIHDAMYSLSGEYKYIEGIFLSHFLKLDQKHNRLALVILFVFLNMFCYGLKK